MACIFEKWLFALIANNHLKLWIINVRSILMQVLLLKNAIDNVNNWLKNTDYIDSKYQRDRVIDKECMEY